MAQSHTSDSRQKAIYMNRVDTIRDHIARSPARVLGRVSTAAEPTLLDADRRALECTSINEREAWLRYFTSVKPGVEEEEYKVAKSEVQGWFFCVIYIRIFK
jgi:hypothetical protein